MVRTNIPITQITRSGAGVPGLTTADLANVRELVNIDVNDADPRVRYRL
jgi:hypothetical protein